MKVNTLLPIKHLKLLIGYGNATDYTCDISPDNVNYTTLLYGIADNTTQQTADTDLVNGLSTFYIRFNKTTTSNYFALTILNIEADIDTSKIPTGLFYPLATNQFTETVKLPSVATRVYFRKAKFENEYGVVCPCLELTDASAVNIGYVPLKLDNSQETNPCVDILTGTTNWQQSGTGSNDSTTGVILNDGEYLTLSTAIAEIKVDYKVGGGTTTFANITKNAYYLSSNGSDSDGVQFPSSQQNVVLGVRQQGVLQRQQDIGEEVELVRQGISDTQQLVRNSALILGYDAGTTDDYAITLPNFTGYKPGLMVLFKANTVNTGACTLNINNMGAIAIVKGITTALSNADILALMWCLVVYDGVSFVLFNPRAL